MLLFWARITRHQSLNNKLYLGPPSNREKIISIDFINKSYGILNLNNGKTKKFVSNINYFNDFLNNNNQYIKIDYSNQEDSINVLYATQNNIEKYNVFGSFKKNIIIKDTLNPLIVNNKLINDSLYIKFSEPIEKLLLLVEIKLIYQPNLWFLIYFLNFV